MTAAALKRLDRTLSRFLSGWAPRVGGDFPTKLVNMLVNMYRAARINLRNTLNNVDAIESICDAFGALEIHKTGDILTVNKSLLRVDERIRERFTITVPGPAEQKQRLLLEFESDDGKQLEFWNVEHFAIFLCNHWQDAGIFPTQEARTNTKAAFSGLEFSNELLEVFRNAVDRAQGKTMPLLNDIDALKSICMTFMNYDAAKSAKLKDRLQKEGDILNVNGRFLKVNGLTCDKFKLRVPSHTAALQTLYLELQFINHTANRFEFHSVGEFVIFLCDHWQNGYIFPMPETRTNIRRFISDDLMRLESDPRHIFR